MSQTRKYMKSLNITAYKDHLSNIQFLNLDK